MSCRQSYMVTRSKPVSSDLLRLRHLEADAVAQAMAFGVAPGLFDRWFVEVEADEAALRIGLGHQQGRKADAAADVRHRRATLQPRLDPVQRGDPGLHDVVDIAGPEELAGRAEQAAGMIAPAHAGAVAEALLDLGLSLDHRRDQLKGAGEIDRAVGHVEHHRLLGREAEALGFRIEVDIAVGGLGQRPFAHIALVQPARARRQLRGGGGALAQRLEQAQAQADPNRRHAHRAAQVGQHLANEVVQFRFVDRGGHDGRPLSCGPERISFRAPPSESASGG